MPMAKQSFVTVSQMHVSVTTLSLPVFPSAVENAAADCDAKHQGAEIDAVTNFVARPVYCKYIASRLLQGQHSRVFLQIRERSNERRAVGNCDLKPNICSSYVMWC